MLIPIVTNYELWAVFGGHPTEKLYMQCLCIFKLWVNISLEKISRGIHFYDQVVIGGG